MDWTDQQQVERDWQHLVRREYRTGWWWGFTSGLLCGGFSIGLLAVLGFVIKAALECPQC